MIRSKRASKKQRGDDQKAMSVPMEPEALKRLLQLCCGKNPVTVYDVLRRRFGQSRVKRAFKDPDGDPELADTFRELDALVDEAWKQKGIDRDVGPYVE